MAGGLEQLGRLRPSWARVDLSRLAANYRAVAAWSPVPVMPVVKADAYGHGAAHVGRLLESLGAPMLAVAYAEEGAALRAAGVRVPIVLLAGFGAGQESLLAEHDLTPVVSTPGTLGRLLDAARAGGRQARIHLKLDSGMARLGFTAAELPSLARRLSQAGFVIEGLATHLAAADQDPTGTDRQLDLFDASIADLARQGLRPRWIHAANSAGLAQLRPTHTLARPGLLLYGIRPRPLSPAIEVRPVMTLSSRIALLKDVPAGSAVSYEGRWVAARPSRIATIPIGYADGVPRTRAMSDRGQFGVRGGRAGVAGTVCMDLVMSDVTDVAGAEIGDEVTVFGDDPGVWDVADWAGTNAWQVLTSVGTRVPRVYVEDGRLVGVESRYLA
jgi:alanine racemase